MHSDGYGDREAHPAINVKVYNFEMSTEAIMARFGCSEAVAQKAIEFAWDAAQRSFWEYWQTRDGGTENGFGDSSREYLYFPGFPDARVESEGRSGGWFVVLGLPDTSEWGEALRASWAKLESDVEADVKYRSSADVVMGDIESNRWAEEGAEEFNFSDGPGGTVCIAEVNRQVEAFRARLMAGDSGLTRAEIVNGTGFPDGARFVTIGNGGGCTCATNADGSDELPHDADCPLHGGPAS